MAQCDLVIDAAKEGGGYLNKEIVSILLISLRFSKVVKIDMVSIRSQI